MLACKNLKAQYLEFVENKGQWDSTIKFKGDMNSGAFFLQPHGYKVVLNNNKDLETISDYFGGHHLDSQTALRKSLPANTTLILHSHAYEVTFAGASANTSIVPEKPTGSYNNYYTGKDAKKWASHCNVYRAITYKNIYPNIDARYYTDNGKAKYDLIVNPGGDISKIVMQFDGVDGLSVKNGNLIVKTSINEVAELAPSTYQVSEKGRSTVDAKYVVIGNTVRFKMGAYSKSSTLVIDPTLIFSSFTGSRADNWGYTATYDAEGNFYAGGIAFDVGFPVTNGAYQTDFHGGDNSEGTGVGYDAVIMKFRPNGGAPALYATYLGGSGDDQPHSLVADNSGNLIIAGRTHSSDFPTQPVGNVYGSGGGFDIFISKLSPDCTALFGSKIIGGSQDDGVNIAPKESQGTVGAVSIRRNYGDDARSEVIVDAANNIYLSSCTQSSDFPVTANAFQPAFAGVLQDGVVIKIAPDIQNVLFSSFLGGSDDDAAFVIALNPIDNNIFVGGGTASTDFPGVNNGSVLYNNYKGGESDGFVSIITNDGSSLIKSTYAGTGGNDLVYGLDFDKLGFPYIMGTTTGSWPVINAGWFQQNGKQFISKLKTDLSDFVYSTVFGSNQALPNISPTAFLVDRCENVYVSGWGGAFNSGSGYPNAGTFGLSATQNNGIRSSSPDNSDFYFFVLKKDAASQLYGGFFGANGSQYFTDHVDGGTSRFDKQGVIYEAICASCIVASDFPTTPGVVGPKDLALGPPMSGAGCNLAAVKIALELAGVGASVRASINGVARDTSGCVPLTVLFNDTLALGKEYIWNFGDGSPDTTTVGASISHTYNNIGNYLVRLISIDSTTCNISDTAFITIRARNDEAPVSFSQLKLPPCDSLKYQFTNTSGPPPPNKPFGPQSFTWDFGDGTMLISNAPVVFHNYTAPGTYIVKLNLTDTNYCNAPDVAVDTLRIAVNVKAQFQTPPSGCAPYDAVFNNTSLAGQQFFWDFGDGSKSTLVSPTHTYASPGIYTVTLLAIDSSTCNIKDDTSFTITVSDKPYAAFSFGPVPPQENTAVTFTNLSTGGTLFRWLFGDGDSLFTVRVDTTIKHIYNKTGTYNSCLRAYNNFGCFTDTCEPVQAIIIPLLDVPNAFTPNGDGVNDIMRVRAFGIDKLNWRIYNRWGALVFESVNQNEGWDGKYKGVLQPQEVYTYVLNVQFTDGTTYKKSGDITLLR